jgi:hypothetical protein
MPQLTPSALARTHPPGLTRFPDRRKGPGGPDSARCVDRNRGVPSRRHFPASHADLDFPTAVVAAGKDLLIADNRRVRLISG